MMGRTHVLVGLASLVAASHAGVPGLEVLNDPMAHKDAWVTAGLAAAFGALAPDIDHPNSKLGQMVPPLSHLANALGGHRGPTHSLLAAGLLALGLHYALLHLGGWPAFSVGFLVGYVSHLLADALTVQGVPLIWPLTSRRFASPLTCTTGGIGETMVSVAAVAGAGWLALGASSLFHAWR